MYQSAKVQQEMQVTIDNLCDQINHLEEVLRKKDQQIQSEKMVTKFRDGTIKAIRNKEPIEEEYVKDPANYRNYSKLKLLKLENLLSSILKWPNSPLKILLSRTSWNLWKST